MLSLSFFYLCHGLRGSPGGDWPSTSPSSSQSTPPSPRRQDVRHGNVTVDWRQLEPLPSFMGSWLYYWQWSQCLPSHHGTALQRWLWFLSMFNHVPTRNQYRLSSELIPYFRNPGVCWQMDRSNMVAALHVLLGCNGLGQEDGSWRLP